MTSLEHLRARLGDRYRIERELGRGGMGAVYLARDLRLDRPVALKVLPEEYAVLPALHERFVREMRMAAGFSHPNIVPVYAVEEADDLLAYAMGFVEGETLAERVSRLGPLNTRDTVRVMQDVGYALAYAHGRDVVHRDIKPDNIMIERATGRALVMDFGIARPIASAPAPGAGSPGPAGLTRVGEVVGTPEYMSPEQATGEPLDGRSDIYSLGLTACYAVSGRTAVTGDSASRILARQIAEPLPPVSTLRPDLPPALCAVIDRCVAKEPDARFPSAEALVEELDAAQLGGREIPLPLRLFAQETSTLLLVIAGAIALAILFLRTAAVQGLSRLDAMLPVSALMAVAATRALQTFREAQRITAEGFNADEVIGGLHAVMDEREQRRAALRADSNVRRARRATLLSAIGMIVIAGVLFRVTLAIRVPVGPQQYEIGIGGAIMVFSAMVLLGIGLVLLFRSPFRMPLPERIYRAIWLGPIGRSFVRLATRRAARGATRDAVATRTPRAAPAPRSAVQPISQRGNGTIERRLGALEQRVAALERSEGQSR